MNSSARSRLLFVTGILLLGCSSNGGAPPAAQGGSTAAYVPTEAGAVVYAGGVERITSEQYVALTQQACSRWSQVGQSVPTSVEFVVDVSGSMLDTAPTTGSQTKWEVTRSALASAITSMSSKIWVGMLFFPNEVPNPNTTDEPWPVEMCVNTSAMIPLAPLAAADSAQRKTILAGLDAAAPAGGTPTQDAYDYALFQGLKPNDQPGNRYMVLITDGQPTIAKSCIGTGSTKHPVDYRPIIAEISTAHSLGVNTFVIGSPGSEMNSETNEDVRYWLSEAASAGGTPVSTNCNDTGAPTYCHFDMSTEPDFAAGFGKALASIAAHLASCSYEMPDPPPGQSLDIDKVNVILSKNSTEYYLVLRAASSNCTSGWYLDAQDNIVLCSETCAQVRQDETAVLELRFGCETIANPIN